jgi:hypothetical protein
MNQVTLRQFLLEALIGVLKRGGPFFDEDLERLMALAKGRIGFSAFRDIDEGGAAGDEPAVGILDGRGTQQNRQQRTVFATDLELQVPYDSSLDETVRQTRG